MNSKECETYCKQLIGLQLLSIEKQDYSWIFVFDDDVSLVTESCWRLLSEERIIVTSEDHNHQFGLPKPVDAAERVLSCVADDTIELVTICAFTGDLSIEFSRQVNLQLLQMSCGYESWSINIHGSQVICTGGGGITYISAV